MKYYIRHRETKKLLGNNNNWVESKVDAKSFESNPKARMACYRLGDVEVVTL